MNPTISPISNNLTAQAALDAMNQRMQQVVLAQPKKEIIRFENVVKEYRNGEVYSRALKGINLSINEGEITIGSFNIQELNIEDEIIDTAVFFIY